MDIIREHKYISLLVLVVVGMTALCVVQGSAIDVFWKTILHDLLVSLIAGSVTSLVLLFFLSNNENENLKEWKLVHIYSKRSEKNKDSDPKLDKARIKVDVIAFGLKSFRETYTEKVTAAVTKGVKFRIITMNPDSKFIAQRDIEENKQEGATSDSIRKLVSWANELNKTKKGSIIIKGYDCMTLDFYWRVDDDIFIGPYWLGHESRDTITYKYEKGGTGFDVYSGYFEELWNNEDLKILTKKQK